MKVRPPHCRSGFCGTDEDNQIFDKFSFPPLVGEQKRAGELHHKKRVVFRKQCEAEMTDSGQSCMMNEQRILLLDVDDDCECSVMEAAARRDITVRTVRTSHEAFKIIRDKGVGLDAIIVDVDPDAHGLALLEAISGCADKPPTIVITSLEETYMKPIALRHGAMACLAKPISVHALCTALDDVIGRSRNCDRWGCLIPSTSYEKVDVQQCVRGVAQKIGVRLIIRAVQRGCRYEIKTHLPVHLRKSSAGSR